MRSLSDTKSSERRVLEAGIALGIFYRAGFDGTKLGDAHEGVRALVRELVEGVRGGDFHAQPSKEACHYCDFNGVCDATRERNLERKAGDPRVQRFEHRGEEYA